MKRKPAALTFAIVLMLLSMQRRAKADEFSFTFTTSAQACSYVSCSGSFSGSGMFMTDSLGLDPALPAPYGASVPGYAITSIEGQMNGAAMTLLTPSQGLIWSQGGPQGDETELFPIFPVLFTAGGKQWTLTNIQEVGPPGANFNIGDGTDGADVELEVKQMPEPSMFELAGLALVGLVGLFRFKKRFD
jgi:hypothetical protein